jgi:hypothetical protein
MCSSWESSKLGDKMGCSYLDTREEHHRTNAESYRGIGLFRRGSLLTISRRRSGDWSCLSSFPSACSHFDDLGVNHQNRRRTLLFAPICKGCAPWLLWLMRPALAIVQSSLITRKHPSSPHPQTSPGFDDTNSYNKYLPASTFSMF